jgi:hypothetical protein
MTRTCLAALALSLALGLGPAARADDGQVLRFVPHVGYDAALPRAAGRDADDVGRRAAERKKPALPSSKSPEGRCCGGCATDPPHPLRACARARGAPRSTSSRAVSTPTAAPRPNCRTRAA